MAYNLMFLLQVQLRDVTDDNADAKLEGDRERISNELLYSIDETPPWYIAIGLGFQVSCLI